MKFNNVIYPGGYLLTSLENDVTIQANVLEIANYKLFYDKDVYVNQFQEGSDSIVIIGYCFDIRDGGKNLKDIMLSLLESKDIENELEYINGRYFIVINKNEKLSLFSDASQLQPLVYHTGTKTLASHDHLLSSFLKEYNIETTPYDHFNHTELDYTRYREIYKKNPSMVLDLNTFKFKRIYPRHELKTENVEVLFKKMKPYLDESIRWLRNNKQEKFLTITAGIDSRVSASMTRTLPNMNYLTYLTPQNRLKRKLAKSIYRIDSKITKEMRDNLKWKHDIINIFNHQPSIDEREHLKTILNSSHSYGLKKYYRDKKRYHHALHIKSTVFGMGKADFNKDLDIRKDSFDFYHKCIHGLPVKFNNKEAIDNYFTRNFIEEGFTKGRHYYDIYHLESRMGNWHSSLTLETDPETDEFIFTNCRKMIDYLQMPSISDRRDFVLYKKIIQQYWPILLFFGLNKGKNLYQENTAKQIDSPDVNMVVSGNMEYVKEENNIIVRPNKPNIKFDDIFKISIVPQESQEIFMSSNYKNTKAFGKIKVAIRTEKSFEEYDILELNEGLKLPLHKGKIMIMILYNGSFSRKSWRDAGKIKFYNRKLEDPN